MCICLQDDPDKRWHPGGQPSATDTGAAEAATAVAAAAEGDPAAGWSGATASADQYISAATADPAQASSCHR